MNFVVWAAILVVFALVIFFASAPKRYFPGPPIVGAAGTMFSALRTINFRHRWWLEWHRKAGPVIQFSRRNTMVFVVYEPDDVKKVLADKETFPDRPDLTALTRMGRNVLSLPANDEWAKHRRLLSPLFAEKFMRSYCALMSPKLSAMSARIRRDAADNGGSVDVLRVVMATALDIIGACGFGVNFGSVETNSNSKFSAASEALLEEIIRLTFVPWWYELLDFKNWFKLRRAITVLESTCDDVRRTTHEKGEERQTMLSELLEMESLGEFTAADVNSDMTALLVAGHETTATTISWALYYIARDTGSLQQRLQAEVDAAFSRKDLVPDESTMTLGVTSLLPLTKATMMEALRVRPTVVAIPRQCVKSFEFPSAPNVSLPAGSIALVSTLSMGFNKAVYGDDVDAFKPERQLDTVAEKRHPFAFLPFGSGQRVCIGRRFATQEGQFLLARIMRDFTVSLPKNFVEPGEKLDLTLKPTGLKLIFTPRR